MTVNDDRYMHYESVDLGRANNVFEVIYEFVVSFEDDKRSVYA